MSKKRKKTKTFATHGSGKERRTVRRSARRLTGIPDWVVSAPGSEPPSPAVVAGCGRGGWSLDRTKPGLKKGTVAAALLGVVCVGAIVPAALAQQVVPSPQPLVAAPLPEVSTGRIIAAGEIPFDPAKMVSAGGPEDAPGEGPRLEKFFSSMLSEALLPSISLADALVAGVGGDELAAAYEDEVSGTRDAAEPAVDEPGVEFASRGPEANRDEPLRSSDDAGDFLTSSLGGDPGAPEEIAQSSPEEYADGSPAAENSYPEEDPSDDLAGMGIPGRSPEQSEPGGEPSGYELASYQIDEGPDGEDSPGTESGEYGEEGTSPDPPDTGVEPIVDASDGVPYVVPADENPGDESPHGRDSAGEEVHSEESPHDEGDFGLAPEAEPEVVSSVAPPDGSSDGTGFPQDGFAGHPQEISDEVDGEDVPGGGIENAPGADEEVEQAVQDYLAGGHGEEVTRLVSEKTTRETEEPPQDESDQETPPDDEPPLTEGPRQTAPPGEEVSPQDGVPAEGTPPEAASRPDGGVPLEGRDPTPRAASDSPESREPDPESNPTLPDNGEPGDEPDANRPAPASPDGDDPHRPEAATPEAERPDGGGPRPSETPPEAPAPEAERERGVRPHGSPENRGPRPDFQGTERQDHRRSADEAAGGAAGSPSQDVRQEQRNDVSQEETMIRVASDGRYSNIERIPPGGEPRRLHRAEMPFAEAVRLARDRYGGRPEGEFARLADRVSPERAQTLAADVPTAPPPAAMPTTDPARSHSPTSPLAPQPELPETTVYQVAPASVEPLPAWQVRQPAVDYQRAAGQAAPEQPLAVAEQQTQGQSEAQQPTVQPDDYGQHLVADAEPVVEQAPVQRTAYEQQAGAQPEPTHSRPSWQTSTVPQNISQTNAQTTTQPPTQAEVQPQPQPWTAGQPQPIPEPEPQTVPAMTPPVQPAARQATPRTNTAAPTLDPAASRTVQSAGQTANPAGQSVSRTVVSSAEGGW